LIIKYLLKGHELRVILGRQAGVDADGFPVLGQTPPKKEGIWLHQQALEE